MRLLRPWLLILFAAPALAQSPFDARDLAPARNQLSNPSFETATPGLPPGYAPVFGPTLFSVSREQAFHGQASLFIRGKSTAEVGETSGLEPTPGAPPAPRGVPPGTPSPPVQLAPPSGAATPPPTAAVMRQDVPACERCTYELSGWIKHAGGQGEAWLALEMLDQLDHVVARQQVTAQAVEADWQPVTVQLQSPRGARMVRVLIGADAGVSAYVDALRLHIVAGRPPRLYPSPISDIHVVRTEATWLSVKWGGPTGLYEVSYRQRRWPKDQRISSRDVPGFVYSLVGLTAQTAYQVQIKLQRPPHYDEQGGVTESPVHLADPKPVTVQTGEWKPREVGLLRLWSTRSLQLMDGPGSNPRIEAAGDYLYLAQEYGGGIHLSKLPPANLEPVWTRELVPPATEGPAPVLQDIHVQTQTLYLLYQRGPTELDLITFNLETEQAEPAVVLPLGEPPTRLSSASLAGYRDQLWVLWLDVTGAGTEAQGVLHLALFNGGALTKTEVWRHPPLMLATVQNPTVPARTLGFIPDEPSLTLFGDELVIPFCDTQAEALEPQYQPLHMIGFNGLAFEGLRKLRDLGRNRQPRARQLGPNLYMLFGSDANYLSGGGRYRDLLLATLLPGAPNIETVAYVDDGKYNVSPDLVALGDSLWTVYDKYDAAATADLPSPYHFGVFIGRIDFGPVGQ